MWIYSGTALTVSWSMVRMSRAKWVMAQLWALHHPPLIHVVASVILLLHIYWCGFWLPDRLFLIKLKHDSLLVKYTPLNVNFMPSSSSTGPVKACEILLHHCPSFYHKLGNSDAPPPSSLLSYLPEQKPRYSQIVTAQIKIQMCAIIIKKNPYSPVHCCYF